MGHGHVCPPVPSGKQDERERELLAAYDRAVLDGQNAERRLIAELQETRLLLDAERKRVQELEGALRASIEQMKRDRHNLRESAQKLQLHDRLLLNAIVIDLDQDIAEAESLLSKEQTK